MDIKHRFCNIASKQNKKQNFKRNRNCLRLMDCKRSQSKFKRITIILSLNGNIGILQIGLDYLIKEEFDSRNYNLRAHY